MPKFANLSVNFFQLVAFAFKNASKYFSYSAKLGILPRFPLYVGIALPLINKDPNYNLIASSGLV